MLLQRREASPTLSNNQLCLFNRSNNPFDHVFRYLRSLQRLGSSMCFDTYKLCNDEEERTKKRWQNKLLIIQPLKQSVWPCVLILKKFAVAGVFHVFRFLSFATTKKQGRTETISLTRKRNGNADEINFWSFNRSNNQFDHVFWYLRSLQRLGSSMCFDT